VKRSLLVEATGRPLAMVIAGANVHDTKLLAATLDAIVVQRPQPTMERPQHLCLDLGYDNPTGAEAVTSHRYIAHLRRIGKESSTSPSGSRASRRAAGSWSARWRSCPSVGRLLIRYDKHAANFLALLQFACALLWFRRLHRLSLLR
jgi:putative transposase